MCTSGAQTGTGLTGPGPGEPIEDFPQTANSQIRHFQEAFGRGHQQVGRFMVMWLRSGPEANLRLGVVASRRSFRKAARP